jgi:hypothetical protein
MAVLGDDLPWYYSNAVLAKIGKVGALHYTRRLLRIHWINP